MKIAICHTDFRLYWLPRLAALANFLTERNSSLHVIEIAGQGSPYAFAGNSDLSLLPCPWTCLFPEERMEDICPKVASSRLYETLDHIHPDIVIAGAIAYPSGATAVRWARNMKRPVIIMDDVRLRDVQRSSLVNWVKRRIYANVDAMFIPATSHASDYKFWNIPEEKMFFGIDVVDNVFFSKRSAIARQNASAVKKKYNLPDRFFLGVGRQIPKKTWEMLIGAFSAAVRGVKNDEWGLVLVGDGPEAPRLKEMASLSDGKIVFLPFQNQEALCQFYGTAECFVLPSGYGETWGLVVNEAMSSSLPVIVSRECGCANTLVRNGYNGWQFDPRDLENLAQPLNRFMLLSDEDKRQMGARSLDIISDWGLERFCTGLWQAVEYCGQLPARSFDSSIVDRIILNLWKGRYRPE